MIKLSAVTLFIFILTSCSTNKKLKAVKIMPAETVMPACLQTLINGMAAAPNGSPQSVTSYSYKNQTVYYLVSPCCDKYNVVYDSACNVLGYPDGGFTGKGDGKMNDFKNEASVGKIVWQKK